MSSQPTALSLQHSKDCVRYQNTTHTNMCKGVWVEKQSPETYILSLPFLLPFLVRNLIAFTVCPCSSVRCRLPLCLPDSVLVLALQMFRTGLRMWLRGKHLPNYTVPWVQYPAQPQAKTPVPPYLLMGFLWGGLFSFFSM